MAHPLKSTEANLEIHDTSGNFIRQHRTRNNITQQELANRAGYTQPYVAQIEGGRQVAFSSILLLANAIGEIAAEKQSAA